MHSSVGGVDSREYADILAFDILGFLWIFVGISARGFRARLTDMTVEV